MRFDAKLNGASNCRGIYGTNVGLGSYEENKLKTAHNCCNDECAAKAQLLLWAEFRRECLRNRVFQIFGHSKLQNAKTRAVGK